MLLAIPLGVMISYAASSFAEILQIFRSENFLIHKKSCLVKKRRPCYRDPTKDLTT
jgi:hypothetical protein